MSSKSNRVEGQGARAVTICMGLICAALVGCRQQNEKPASRTDSAQPKHEPRVVGRTAPVTPLLTASELPAKGTLPFYELRIAPKDLAQLEQNSFANDTYPAIFVANGVVYDKAKVRFRGEWARTWPKKPLKIFFDHRQLFEGRRCIDLNSGWRDPAFIREPLAYRVYAACGVPSPRARMVRLNINGHFRGLYVDLEQPDKSFLDRINLKGASLFKAISKAHQSDERDLGNPESYASHYDPETQKSEGFAELYSLCHGLALTKDRAEFFSQRLDLDKYINYLAANTLVQNWDCFNKNHFLLYDGRNSKKWWVVPWDLDRTFGDHWEGSFDDATLPILLGTRPLPGPTGWNRLEAHFFADPGLRSRFLDRLDALLQKEFTPEKLFPVIDQLESDISAAAALDRSLWPGSPPNFHRGIAEVKGYITRRRSFLQKEVARLRQNKTGL